MTADDLMRLINRYVEACDDLGEGLFEKPLTTTDALHAKATALHGQILDEVYRLHALAAAQPPAAMPGWRLVPVEPTQAMCAAAVKFANGNAVYKNVAAEALKIEEAIYGEAYAAMLAAAPTPQAQSAPATGAQPEFDHSIGEDRYTVTKSAFWWHVRIGDSTANVGKFYTRHAAEDMALKLLTAFRDGAFSQRRADLAAPTGIAG